MKIKTIKHLDEIAKARALERKAIREIRQKAKGSPILIRCWTASTGSSSETHAKTIKDAVKFLRENEKYHANFVMRRESQPIQNATRH